MFNLSFPHISNPIYLPILLVTIQLSSPCMSIQTYLSICQRVPPYPNPVCFLKASETVSSPNTPATNLHLPTHFFPPLHTSHFSFSPLTPRFPSHFIIP